MGIYTTDHDLFFKGEDDSKSQMKSNVVLPIFNDISTYF